MDSYLYHNNHDGTFTNVAQDVNVAFGANGEGTSAMGPIWGDYDNDGWQDLFVSDMRYHRLFHNPRNEKYFLDSTQWWKSDSQTPKQCRWRTPADC
jgi:hypothetical protein